MSRLVHSGRTLQAAARWRFEAPHLEIVLVALRACTFFTFVHFVLFFFTFFFIFSFYEKGKISRIKIGKKVIEHLRAFIGANGADSPE